MDSLLAIVRVNGFRSNRKILRYRKSQLVKSSIALPDKFSSRKLSGNTTPSNVVSALCDKSSSINIGGKTTPANDPMRLFDNIRSVNFIEKVTPSNDVIWLFDKFINVKLFGNVTPVNVVIRLSFKYACFIYSLVGNVAPTNEAIS